MLREYRMVEPLEIRLKFGTLRTLTAVTPRLLSIAAEAVGYGSMMTIVSTFSIAFFISGPRVCEFGACPQKTMALRFES